VDTLFRVFPLISVISIFIMIFSWPFLGENRLRYPTVFILHLAGAMLVISISFLFRLGAEVQGGSQTDIVCHNEYTFADHNDAACVAQGFLFMWSSRTAVLMWFVITLNMYMVIVRGSQWVAEHGHALVIGSQIISGVPTIIAASIHKLNAAPAGAWCNVDQSSYGLYNYVLGVGDMEILLIVAIVLSVLTFRHVMKQKLSLPASILRLSLVSIKMSVILIWILVGLLASFYARTYGSFEEDKYEEDIVGFVTCIFTLYVPAPETFLTGMDLDIDYTSCHIKRRPQFAASYAAFTILSVTGMFMFIVFVLPTLLSRNLSSTACVDEIRGLKNLLHRLGLRQQSDESQSTKAVAAIAFMPSNKSIQVKTVEVINAPVAPPVENL
jgi:hypothetical protein